MKTLLSLILILCLAQSLQAQYLKAYTEGKRRETKEQYYDAILAYNAAYNTPDKPATNDLQKRIDFCANQLKKQQDEIKLALKTAEEALKKADEMQRKVETAMFDKAVKERNKDWKGYVNMCIWRKLDATGIEILSKIDSLDLSNNALLRLPHEITECPNLKYLNLIENWNLNWKQSEATLEKLQPPLGMYVNDYDVDSIPSKYWKLITGVISTKQLTQIPANILQQTQLTHCNLSGNSGRSKRNSLSNLSEIGKLKNLTYLFLKYCQIDSLPSDIGNLANLMELNLAGNKLSTLPSEIGILNSLTNLNLTNNIINTLPAEIGKLTSLTYLDLRFNKLTTISSEIGKLTNLTYLNLYSNQLSTLPTEIVKLTNLKYLYLGNNNFTEPEKQKIKTWLPKCEISWQ